MKLTPIWAEGLTDEDRDIIAERGQVAFEACLAMLRGDEYDWRVMRFTPQSLPKSTRVGHFYQPLHHFCGRVLKYQGIATAGNLGWMMSADDGTIVLPEFIGDRIWKDTHMPLK